MPIPLFQFLIYNADGSVSVARSVLLSLASAAIIVGGVIAWEHHKRRVPVIKLTDPIVK